MRIENNISRQSQKSVSNNDNQNHNNNERSNNQFTKQFLASKILGNKKINEIDVGDYKEKLKENQLNQQIN